MMNLNPLRIPAALTSRRQWVLWKIIERNGEKTKVPFQVNGEPAKSSDPATWNEFATVYNFCSKRTDYDGIGFVFSADDPFCGIDLDGCRDPATSKVAEWARRIILDFDTYAEVSPSGSGVKLFLRGTSPMDSGKKKNIDEPAIGGKTAAIEIYDHVRYFAVTGLKLKGPDEIQERQTKLSALVKELWPEQKQSDWSPDYYTPTAALERARKYIATMPPAVSGQGGHNAAFSVACRLVLGFGLGEQEALTLMHEWNQTCQPPWSERELTHKVRQAAKQPGERNYLRNTPFEKWGSVKIPDYQLPTPKSEPRITTLKDATKAYIERLRSGGEILLDTGLPDVDHALGGGIEYGELVILAARPSHGKSAVALQTVHSWTLQQRPCLVVSEEMSAIMLGKRSLQFLTDVHQEHWRTRIDEIDRHTDEHYKARADAIVVESCVTVDAAIEQIDRAVDLHKIKLAAVDYGQILRGVGKERHERAAYMSLCMAQAAKRHNIVVLLLCQLNREVEGRKKFMPTLSDIRDTGNLEQDADVIMFLVWPWKVDSKNHPDLYQVFIAKNRNRAINQPAVNCRFVPSRQMILPESVKQMKNYSQQLNDWNDREPSTF